MRQEEVGPRGRRSGALAGLVTVCLTMGAVGAGVAAPVVATVEGGVLTLDARSASVAQVFQAIGQAGGFSVVLEGNLDEPVTRTIRHQPLGEALQDLGGAHSVVLLFGPGTEGDRIREVRVYENRHGPRAAELRAETTQDPGEATTEPADPGKDALAIPKASLLPARDAARALAGVLSDRGADPKLRSRAVATLTKVEGPQASRLLQRTVLMESEPPLRMQALRALATQSGGLAVPTLGLVLRTDPEARVRAAAVTALARLGGDAARVQLRHATADGSAEVRRAAGQALAGVGRAND